MDRHSRIARRKKRREKIRSLIKLLAAEIDDLTDDIEEGVRGFVEAPGAPENPDMKVKMK